MKTVKVKVLRTDPDRRPHSWVQDYDVPVVDGMSVADVLKHIQEEIDGSLAFYCSCKVGLCAGCSLRVNGKPSLACATPVSADLTLEPLAGTVVRDLVVKPRGRD